MLAQARPAPRAIAGIAMLLLACGANSGEAKPKSDQLAVHLEMQSDGGPGGMGDVVGLAVFPDGSVVVGDAANAQLVHIDAGGAALARAGRRGAAPGEYSRLQWVGSCGSGYTAHDIALSRLSMLNDSLRVLTSKTIPKAFDSRDVAGCLADGRVLIMNDSMPRPNGVQRRPLSLVAFDTRNGHADTLSRFRGTEMNYVRHLGTSIAVPLGARTHVSATGNGIVVAESDRDSLWQYDGGKWRVIALEGIPGAQRTTAVDAERARQLLAWAPRTTQDRAFAPALLAETANATVKPRIDGLVAADNGVSWVAMPPAANGTRSWIAYNDRGKRAGSAEFVWTFEPRLVRGENWYGVQRDSIGVESVVRYRVTSK